MNSLVTHVRLAVIGLVVCAGLLASAVAARAQDEQPRQRPYQGLFGGAGRGPTVDHTLDLSATVLGGYDKNVLADTYNPVGVAPYQVGGFFSGVVGSLGYGWRGEKVNVGATAGTGFRYLFDTGDFYGIDHNAGVGMSVAFSERTRLRFNQSFNYSPSYAFGLFPPLEDSELGGVIPPAPDFAADDVTALTYDSSAEFTYGLSRRSSLWFGGSFRRTDFDSVRRYRDLSTYDVGGHYSYSLSRNANVHLGYTYVSGQYGGGVITSEEDTSNERTVMHNLDVGIDYGRSIGLTRRTTLDFSVGSTIVTRPGGDEQSTDADQTAVQGSDFRVIGNAGLNHEFGRSWRARVDYRREVSFLEGFNAPVYTDGIGVGVGGYFSRRVDFGASAGYSFGTVGATNLQGNDVDSINVSVQMRYAVARHWALFAEYLLYTYGLGPEVDVPLTVSPALDRNGVRVGLTLWTPLFRR